MPRLDTASLKKVSVHVCEKNYYERTQLRDMFIAQGIKSILMHATLEGMREALMESPPDMLVISDDFDAGAWDAIKEIRHQKLGENPFMLITVLVNPARREALQLAINAGVDDVVIKPVTSERVRERIALVTFHRAPFVAHGEYVGPERRNADTPQSGVRRIPVLNTILEKVNGKEFDRDSLRQAIGKSLEKVLQAQLDSQSSRLGEVCDRLLIAYDSKAIVPEVQNDLILLSNVLQEAGAVAERLKDMQLVGVCQSLSDNIIHLSQHYDEPSSREIDLLRKITQAFQMAMEAPKPPPEAIKEPEPLSNALDLGTFASATS